MCVIAEAGKDKLSECEVAVTIGKLLETPGGADQQDVILELLANLAENGMYILMYCITGMSNIYMLYGVAKRFFKKSLRYDSVRCSLGCGARMCNLLDLDK